MPHSSKNSVATMTWGDVSQRLADGAVAILPIGAGAKQHGRHMPMSTDQIQAEWFAERLSERTNALIWPTLTYGSYPAFTAYSGSISLSEPTFEALVSEVIRQLLFFGIKRIYILNTGISTISPVERAITTAGATHHVRHLKIYRGTHFKEACFAISQQLYGSHADEIETSIMLAMAPEHVDMKLAQASPLTHDTDVPGLLDPVDIASPNYSPSGSFGDPLLAAESKGLVLLKAILADFEAILSEPDEVVCQS
jgi:creatinine amidohydrolase